MTTQESVPTGTRVVVGVDGSPSSRSALRWAERIATSTGAGIEAVTAWQYPPSYGWPMAVPDGWRPDVDAAKALEQTLDEVFGTERPARLTTSVREGYASRVLLDASEGAAVLVVGSRGHGGFAGLLLGSVSAACAEHATCAVLVVHADPPPLP